MSRWGQGPPKAAASNEAFPGLPTAGPAAAPVASLKSAGKGGASAGGSKHGSLSKAPAGGKNSDKGGGYGKGKSDGKGKDGKDREKGKGEKKGGGKGKGATPWSFIPVCGDQDPLGLWALSEKIPEAWIDTQHGGRRDREHLHVTFMLKMFDIEHLMRLEDMCGHKAPVELRVKELFLERVERIRDAEVYCIGVAFTSPGLRGLKEAWLKEADSSKHRLHDPYPDSDGHVSLAYVYDWAWVDAEDFVQNNKSALEGRAMTVDGITYEDHKKERTKFALCGNAEEQVAAASAAVDRPVVEVDGSVLEGGGQILRNSLAYSAIFRTPVRITKIRAGRKVPGLAAQHLECFKLVRDVSNGRLSGDKLKSCEVSFEPQPLKEGSFSADPKTAGAITLMLQAALFPLAFAGGTSEVTLKGGTDVDFSPPLDFLQRVLKPCLNRMGVEFDVTCEQRGFYPAGGGHVNAFVTGLKDALKPIQIAERGVVTKVEVICYATPRKGWLDEEEVQRTEEEFEPWIRDELTDKGQKAPKVRVRCEAEPPPDSGVHKAVCEIVVETSKGGFFHSSSGPFDGPKGQGWGHYSIWGEAAEKALGPLKKQLQTGAALDAHLVDQLILPAALADGTSRLLAEKDWSLHAQTAVHIAEKLVPGVRFRISNPAASVTLIECDGIGLRPGSATIPAAGGVPLIAHLASGTLGNAAESMLAELRVDLQRFSDDYGVKAQLDVNKDCIVVNGCCAPQQAAECGEMLGKILDWWQLPVDRWTP
eukprot:TRINITY_DN6145_c0_g1_i1.p1 TRINITY_DN6145_c0_g1~~TRINITY_DN6145_c0_g1_i1.p1  ORF type:complete len:760 (+),score=178.31 TRINITY_DN6145_c0_g1_i1:68-2347(+)